MTVNFTGTDLDGVVLTLNNDLWITTTAATVANDVVAFDFDTTEGNRLIVQGTIVSEDNDAIDAAATSGNNTVDIAKTGLVSGDSDGIEMAGTNHAIVNNGIVNGFGDAGIQLVGEAGINNGTVVNYGTVFGNARAIQTDGTGAFVNNAGDVSSASAGIELADADSCDVVNSGSVTGVSSGVSIASATGATNSILNTGTIVASAGASIEGDDGNEIVDNAGVLIGDVDLFGGADVVFNSGLIEGTVDLGEGDDLYKARIDGVTERVLGGLGADTLNGGSDGDGFIGGDGFDSLRGKGGDDDLDGDLSNDLIRGGTDDDTLTGGRGNDTMTGGSGFDTFVIIANADNERITDFDDKEDELDFSALGFATVDDAIAVGAEVGGDVVFSFGGNDVLTVEGAKLNKLEDVILI